MSNEYLENLVKIGKLKADPSSDDEIEKRYLVFQCTQHTIDLRPEYWRILSDAHRVRNVAEYEGDIVVNRQLLEALIRVVDILAERVQELVK